MKEIILKDGIIVNLQNDGRVKFTSSSSGIESFIENTNEDPRQEHMFLLALGNIDGADAVKLSSFLKENHKDHIYNYLAKNRPELNLKKIEVDKKEKTEEKIETKGEQQENFRNRAFKAISNLSFKNISKRWISNKNPINHEGPIKKAIKNRRKWYKSYKSFFLKKGELTKNEQKKLELLSTLTSEEAKKHIDKSPLKIAMDLRMDKEVAKMIDQGYILKRDELKKDLTKEAIKISSELVKKRTMAEEISGSLSNDQLKTLADVRKHLLRDTSNSKKKDEVINIGSKPNRKIVNSLRR